MLSFSIPGYYNSIIQRKVINIIQFLLRFIEPKDEFYLKHLQNHANKFF